MNNHHKLVAAARRLAKKLAHESSNSYQKCLDVVAREAGRATWSDFLRDPVPVDEDSRTTAAAPDFTTMAPSDHLRAIVRHGMMIEATSFTGLPKAWNDPSPILEYGLAEDRRWGIDAHGLDLVAVAVSCGHDERPSMRFEHERNGVMPEGAQEGRQNLLPVVEGLPMRASSRLYGHSGATRGAVSATLDGSEPAEMPRVLTQVPIAPQEPWTPPKDRTSFTRRLMESIGSMIGNQDDKSVERAIRTGSLRTDHGPVIGIARGRSLRLRHGHHLVCHSPPGTGRLTGIAVPAILSDPHGSHVVHDDGQIHAMTSGHRATLGRVATIRIDSSSMDSINPFGAEWMDGMLHRNGYIDDLSKALFPKDADIARVVSMTAIGLVDTNGRTTIGEIRDAIAEAPERPWTRRVLTALHPMTTESARRLTDTSTVVPADLNGTGSKDEPRPLTLYIVRDPLCSGRRHPIAAAIQTAIWYHTLSTLHGHPMRSGAIAGPCPVTTMIWNEDDAPLMPMLAQAFDLGRSKASSMVLLGTVRTSIETRRSREDAIVLKAVMGMRIVLPQADPDQLDAMDPEGLVGSERVAALEFGDAHLMPMNGIAPIPMRLPLFFEDAEMNGMTFSRGSGPSPVETSS